MGWNAEKIFPIAEVKSVWDASTNITSKNPDAQNAAISPNDGCIGINVSDIIILFLF